MRTSKAVRFFDFSGGQNSKSPVTSLDFNEAIECDNIVLYGTLEGSGFEKRRGNSVLNSSAMGTSKAVNGLGYFRKADASDFIVATCDSKIFKTDSLDGTMDEITGGLTVSDGTNATWTSFTMNNVIVFVGGAPNAPFTYSGSGNAAALGGTPPNGNFGLTANNRAFIGNTSAAPSTIYWSILGDHTDWSGTGSGNTNVSQSDGDVLIGGAQLGIDHLILFKQNSIHDLAIRTAPFPLFPIRRGANIGAIAKNAIISVDNMIYYITPEPRMKATDGNKIYDFPNKIDDVWDGLNKTYLKYACGVYYPRLRQIWWMVPNGTSTTNNLCIVWDLVRNCWLKYSTGYKMNLMVLAQDRYAYGGAFDGKIYLQDVASRYYDASETSQNIKALWRSGWYDVGSLIQGKVVPYVKLNFVEQTSGVFTFSYGYNFSQDRKSESINMSASSSSLWGAPSQWGVMKWGGQDDKSKIIFTKGNGEVFQYAIKCDSINDYLKFNGLEIPIRLASPEAMKVS